MSELNQSMNELEKVTVRQPGEADAGEDQRGSDASSEVASTDPKIPAFPSRYQIVRLLGKGGMGEVYQVTDQETGKDVAIKVLKAELSEDPMALKRFESETSTLEILSHPNLVTIYGHGKTLNGAPYLVMDLADGPNLSQLLEEHGKLPSARATGIFLQICSVLEYAHGLGVVHRDLKPTNVIVSARDGRDLVRVVDFGIAKVMPSASIRRETYDLTETQAVFGSPHYMSPEHCLGMKLDERSDIYSLGCLMYECLTGTPPFTATNPIQVVVKHINEEPALFADKLARDKLTDSLEDIIFECLAKDPTDRFQSISEVSAALKSAVDGKHKRQERSIKKPVRSYGRIMSMNALALIAVACPPFFFNELISVYLQPYLAFSILGALLYAYRTIDAVRSLEGRAYERDWWICLQYLFLAATFLAAVARYNTQVDLATSSVIQPLVIQIICACEALVAIVGGLLFLKGGLIGFSRVGIKFLICSGIMVLPMLVILDLTSRTNVYRSLEMADSGDFADRSGFAEYTSDKEVIAIRFAESLNQRQNYGEALQVLDVNVKASNSDPRYFEVRAESFRGIGNLEQALLYINRAIAVHPKRSSLIIRSQCYEQQRDFDKALADLESAARISPGDADVTYALGRLYCAMGKYTEALRIQNDIMKHVGGDTAQNRIIRATLFEKIDDQQQARCDYLAAIEYAHPRYDEIIRAFAYRRLGKIAQYEMCMRRIGFAGSQDLNQAVFPDKQPWFELVF
ncbi:MAG: protein kinase [Cyanobacteria bacterium]|nr:protein kinase [Cyanobacteriota bacterium]